MSVMTALALLVALHGNEAFDELPLALLLLGTLGNVLALANLVASPVNFAIRLGLAGNENPLAVGQIGSILVYAALVIGLASGKNRWWVGAVSAVCFVLGFLSVLLSVVRSEIISVLLVSLFYVLWLRRWVGSIKRKLTSGATRNLGFAVTFVGIVVAIPAVIGTLFSLKFITAMIAFVGLRFGALSDVVGGKISNDVSLSLHEEYFRYGWQHLDVVGHGIDVMSYRFGSGIYPHMNYLQSVLDFGVIGGIVYALVAAVFPAAILVLRITSGPLKPVEGLIVLLFLDAQAQMMTHGTPYSWQPWLPIMLVYLLFVPRYRALPIWTRRVARRTSVKPIASFN
jgi:hypothetical protein